MSLFSLVVGASVFLGLAYWLYGGLLGCLLHLDPDVTTPAVELRDEVDYVPIEPQFLLGQHFSAIAAAGPIVGPITAGVLFGWLPALLWILLGSIFIGGVHDLTALTASIRHRARSIAEVVREHMTHRSYVLFLLFVWMSLVYIIVAFTDVTTMSFIKSVTLENGQQVTGGGIATSSLLYLALPICMGLLMRYTRLTLGWATVIFMPLVAVAIIAGQYIPFDLGVVLGISPAAAQKVWNVLLLAYCMVASVVPMWLLLQPRGHLGGYFLYVALAAGAIGVLLGGNEIKYPAFLGWTATGPNNTVMPLFPLLFITIACGACSGFHSLIASGTTSKQLRRETDAKPIGYGAMLLEAMVAIVSLACVMILSVDSPLVKELRPNFLYARGIGNFLGVVGLPVALGVSFGLMAFTTFVYDTLDVCTRLGRYVLEELTGWHGRAGRWFATTLTAGVPLSFLLWQPVDAKGNVVPLWQVFWSLFGASNQLLAALTLLGVTVWLWQTRRAMWVWFVTGLPTLWMYSMSMWALASMTVEAFSWGKWPTSPVPYVASILLVLGALILVEALRVLGGGRPGTPLAVPEPVALATT